MPPRIYYQQQQQRIGYFGRAFITTTGMNYYVEKTNRYFPDPFITFVLGICWPMTLSIGTSVWIAKKISD